jgi:hypothetical protein
MMEIDNLLTTQNLKSLPGGPPYHLLRMGTFEIMYGISGMYDQQDAIEVCMFRCGATLRIQESLVQEIVAILRNLWARPVPGM